MRKAISKVVALVMVLTMMLSMSINVFAAGETGTLTINNTTAGKSIDTYQLFSATKSGTNVAYTLNAGFEGYFKANVATCNGKEGEALSEAAYTYVAGLSETARTTFAKNLLGWILDNSTAVADLKKTTASTATSTTISDLAYGYYVVYPVGATNITGTGLSTPAMLVDITNATATITMKSQYPTVEKGIVEHNGGVVVDDSWDGKHDMELDALAGDLAATDVAVGDTLRFRLTSTVPDMTGYESYTFNFHDTLSVGLTYKKIVSVKVGNTTLTLDNSETPAKNTYKFTPNGQNLTIELNQFIDYKNQVGATVEVLYDATLNENAVVGMNPNTNSATVEYSNDPTNGGTGTSEPSIVNVHTFDFTIFKFHGEPKEALAGAEFELYAADGTTKINLIDEGEGVYRQATATEAAVGNFTSAIIVSDADGKVQVKGLDAGTYILKETKAPEGYNKLVGDVTIVITPAYDGTTGLLTKVDVSYTYNGVTNASTVTDGTNSPEVPVENKSGSILPDTGSTGTILFTIFGVLVIAAMVTSSIISKKKKRA